MPLINREYLHKELHTLRNSAVRDLAWCCFSAPMMSNLPDCNATIFPLHSPLDREWLRELDQAPQHLFDHLQTLKSSRLGIYYEALWHFYFQHHPEWELLRHNLQVDRKGITLGAFDFLCRRGDTYWHIETAVKFYLCAATDPAQQHHWHHWIGPGGEDRLDLKLNHLRNHQLPLHQLPEGDAALRSVFPQALHWNTGLCLQGYLFSALSHPAQPEFSHPDHGHGHWVRLAELYTYLKDAPADEWAILERRQWLAPAQVNEAQLIGCDALFDIARADLHANGRPLLVAQMGRRRKDLGGDCADECVEQSRFFVTPDDWPHQSMRPGADSPSRNI